jgi:hypothetical protein
MGELINIGGIDSALCDKSLLNLLNSIFFKVNIGIDNLYNNLIQTKKYQEIRSKIIDSQFNYLEELKNEKRYSHPPRSEFFIFDSSLAENILELMSSYHIMLTHEGMCNLINYFFYDVYCSKKSLPPHYSFAKPTEDDAYEDRKFYNPDYTPSEWNWDKNIVFEGINENAFYEVNARKFWENFAQELLQKLGSIYIQLITHDYNDKHIIESYNDNFFIVQTHAFTFADEPWYGLYDFSRILNSHNENAKDSSGKFFTNYLYSSNPLPDFYKSETDTWRPDCATNLYSPSQRMAYGVFQKLKELDISTNTILSGTVHKVQNPRWQLDN